MVAPIRAPSGGARRAAGTRAPSTIAPTATGARARSGIAPTAAGGQVPSGTGRPPIFAALALTIVAACVVPASAQQGSQPSLDADLAAIEDFNARYVEAINRGDLGALAELTTDDHLMIVPNRAPLAGKAALVETMERAFAQTEIDEAWMPLETVIDGDLAYQRGTYRVDSRPKSGGEWQRTTGSFLRIYRRQPNGEWRMTRDTFNSHALPDDTN